MVQKEVAEIVSRSHDYISRKDYKLSKTLTEGLSGSLVWVVRNPQGRNMVLKVQSETSELDFYTSVRPNIDRDNRWTPIIYETAVESDFNYLLMEHIPNSWDSNHWNKDTRAIRILAELHATTTDTQIEDRSNWLLSDISTFCNPHLPRRTIEKILKIHKRAFKKVY